MQAGEDPAGVAPALIYLVIGPLLWAGHLFLSYALQSVLCALRITGTADVEPLLIELLVVVVTAVAGACSEHKHISFDYDKAQNPRWGHVDGDAPTIGASVTRRCVEPVGLVSSGYRWYLVAWDVERGAWRTFRVDRIRGGVEVGASFVPRTPPDDGDLQTYVSRAVSVEPYEQQARIRLQVPLAIAAQALAPAAGVLEAVDDHSCVLTTGAASMEALAYHLLTLGVDFEVESPQALIATLRQLQERLAKALA